MIEIDWLSPEEQSVYRVFSRMSRDLFNHFDCDLKRDVGIPRPYYEILFVLGAGPAEGMRMTDLAEGTRSAPSRMTHAVGRLEDDGLVSRRPSTTDGRGWTISLTDEGAALLRRAAARHAASVRAYLLDALTGGQRETLREISEKVIARIEEVADEAPGGER